MVKHTINAFLATSITFVNEIATLCERLGADAGEVEAGIRSEPRIGQRAYVTPGGAFGGGTLARDVAFLSNLAAAEGIPVPLIAGILPSNLQHVGWVFRRICDLFGQSGEAQSGEAQSGEAQSGAARSGEARSGGARLAGVRAAVLGLAYKANTSSLRRSTAVELCSRLYAAGAEVRAFDPAVSTLPPELAAAIRVLPTAAAAFTGADVLVVATEWSEFKELESAAVVTAMRRPLVIDQNGFLAQTLGRSGEVAYLRVGKAA
jgi:UDPglucose 6-dehydrogenase